MRNRDKMVEDLVCMLAEKGREFFFKVNIHLEICKILLYDIMSFHVTLKLLVKLRKIELSTMKGIV